VRKTAICEQHAFRSMIQHVTGKVRIDDVVHGADTSGPLFRRQ
jgi:hypothetical protein